MLNKWEASYGSEWRENLQFTSVCFVFFFYFSSMRKVFAYCWAFMIVLPRSLWQVTNGK